MYICQLCNRNIGPRVRQIKKVVATRKKTYRKEDGRISIGWEIVREINICLGCNK